MKKIDKLVFGAFLGPFLMTFLVVVFILLMQHMLKYFDDIIGKGLGWDVIGQLLFYFAIFMTPVALPLAVLLSSLIAFGNLGEHFELTAIKSAGISLVRALFPIFVFVVLLTGVAFYANNNLVPKAALEAYSLLYDIKQKKPALDLREGAFYNGINDISIKVNKKYPDGITLKDVIVYDHRKNEGNREVTIADSGKMYTILNERYLKFELFNGYNYSQTSAQREIDGSTKNTRKGTPESYMRRKFAKSQVVFDLSSFDLERTDKKWFQGNRIMRNLNELTYDMDSIHRESMNQRLNYYEYMPSYFTYWTEGDMGIPAELKSFRVRRDSLTRLEYMAHEPTLAPDSALASRKGSDNPPVMAQPDSLGKDSVAFRRAKIDSAIKARKTSDSLVALKSTTQAPPSVRTNPKVNPSPKRKANPNRPKLRKEKSLAANRVSSGSRSDKVRQAEKPVVLSDSARSAKIDSLFNDTTGRDHLDAALTAARQVKTQISNSNSSLESYEKEWTVFKIQWHKILASSLACIAMFMIGAPLGAIIKKGGLGMPFLVSILFFIVYYVLTMQGEKLAKQGTISVGMGVWMADFILFCIGLVFLRQARADARLFEADFYSVIVYKVARWFATLRT
jgi:lipopolysaccharide export system permease protein